jgi:uncharacterized protein
MRALTAPPHRYEVTSTEPKGECSTPRQRPPWHGTCFFGDMDSKVVVALMAPLASDSLSPLVSALGARRVRRLENAFLHDMWSSIETEPWTNGVLVTPELSTPALARDIPAEKLWAIESVGAVGHRLEQLFARLLQRGRGALLVSGMTPALPAGHWTAAREAIQTADAVVGPTRDGGLYLLGFRQPVRGVLHGLDWSSSDLALTLVERLRDSGHSVALLAPWIHVESPEDLIQLRTVMLANELRAANTRALLFARPSLVERVKQDLLSRWDRVRERLPSSSAV